MVSLQTVQQSNGRIPAGLVALFIGATSGIGQGALQHFAQHAPSSHIHTIARPSSVPSHEELLSTLRQTHLSDNYALVSADVSLVSEIDRVVSAMTQKESKLDLLVLSAGFMAFEGRRDTREGMVPSMSTHYYSRLRAVERLVPLLNASPSPRILSVLAGGMEAPLNEADLDLRSPGSWSFWNASVHAATMGTLALERVAHENPRLSVVHWFPGPMETPGLARARELGMSPPNPMGQEEAGARAVFLATSDRYAVSGAGGVVPVAEGLGVARKSGGGVTEKVWSHTQEVFAGCADRLIGSKDEL